MEKDVEIGIFGGTGIYDSGLLENAQEIEIDTPYGKPSDTITVGIFKGRKINVSKKKIDSKKFYVNVDINKIKKTSLFDEKYFLYFEEIDLFYQCKQNFIKVYFIKNFNCIIFFIDD